MTRDATRLDDLLAGRPDLAEPLEELETTLRAGPVEPALLDACDALIRHRIGVPVDGAVPDVGEVADPRAHTVLLVAEQFVVDPHGIDDELRDRVLDHCSLAELATLMVALAVFDARARMEAVLDERPAEEAS